MSKSWFHRRIHLCQTLEKLNDDGLLKVTQLLQDDFEFSDKTN